MGRQRPEQDPQQYCATPRSMFPECNHLLEVQLACDSAQDGETSRSRLQHSFMQLRRASSPSAHPKVFTQFPGFLNHNAFLPGVPGDLGNLLGVLLVLVTTTAVL